MKSASKRFASLCISVTMLVSYPAFSDNDYEQAQQLREAGEILPLETILEKLHARHPGKVLEVELENEDGHVIYEIEILDNMGKVWKIKVNAKTGEQIQQEKDD
jgi:uncharacterized membrane protein YkoI